MEKYDVGVIGMAVMGQNLARNIANNGFKTLIYNRTVLVTHEVVNKYGFENLQGANDLNDFVSKLNSPRKIIIMVKAGKPVDDVIESLLSLLDPSDIIIDAGNSYYKDTDRRFHYLQSHGIKFVGTGVSGGEEGALKGPSIMPGCEEDVWYHLKPIFELISAEDFSGGKCVAHIGTKGSGHYVKMVHNGIEYAIMQMIAEVYDIFRKGFNLKANEISNIFNKYNEGRLNSYLLEITKNILLKEDEFNDGYLIDFILDKAGNKGTGKRTSIDALDRGIPVPSIIQAVIARYISSYKSLRVDLSEKFENQYENEVSLEKMIELIESSLYLGIISAYAQGFHLISQVSKEEGWNVNMSQVARIWQGGCIIRAKLLELLSKSFEKYGNELHLFQIPEIQELFQNERKKYIKLIKNLSKMGMTSSVLMLGYSYFEMISSKDLGANLIQGQRDYFGAHTYERIDRDGIFHTKW